MFITVWVWLPQSPSWVRNPKCVGLRFINKFIEIVFFLVCWVPNIWNFDAFNCQLHQRMLYQLAAGAASWQPMRRPETWLSGDVAKRIRLSWLCRSSGRRLRIRHSLSSSASDTPRMAAIFLKSAVSGFIMSSVCICHIDNSTGYS